MKKPCFIIFFLLFGFISKGQAIYFNKIHNYNDELGFGFDVFQLGDTGYVTLDCPVNIQNGNGDIHISFFDSIGNLKFQKAYTDSGYEFYVGEWGSMRKTFDGGYAFGGSSVRNMDNSSRALLVKLNARGDTEFVRYFGDTSTSWQAFYHCVQTYDSGYALLGGKIAWQNGSAQGYSSFYLVRTDKDGNLLWQKTYGGFGQDAGYTITQLTNHNLVLCGYQTYNFTTESSWIIETDSAGNIVNQKLFDSGAYTCGNGHVCSAFKNQYVFWGCLDTLINPNDYPSAGFFALLDSSFNAKWKIIYNDSEYHYIYEVRQLVDSSFIIIGTVYGNLGWISKADKYGNKIWSHSYHFSLRDGFNYFADIQQTRDKGFIITGASDDTTNMQHVQSLWLIKLDSNGIFIKQPNSFAEITSDKEGLLVFPNPSSEEINIETEAGIIPDKIDVISITGKILKQVNPSQAKTRINIKELPQGIYFLQIKAEKGIEVKKFVKE